MEQPATAPAISNAIRGAEQSGNIAKTTFRLDGGKRLEVHGNMGWLDKQVIGSAA